jgi:predicted nucleic acid-binding protein
MNDKKILLDTNLWVYLYTTTPQAKYHHIRQIVEKNFNNIVVSTQILGELYHVLTRKNLQTEVEAKEIIIETIAMFPILGSNTSIVLKGIDIHERYRYSYWDSLLLATAIFNGVHSFYSEDMQHNQLIENKTRIINPFIL